MKSRKELKLESGRNYELIEIKRGLIPNYYLLAFPKSQGEPTVAEVSEMVHLGITEAKRISLELLDDEEAFTILYSGYSARREKGWHIHIILLGNRWKKTWLYFVLSLKNLAQAFGLRKDDSPKLR